MQVPEVEPVAVCDVYQPHLERAVAAAKKGGHTVKTVKDFREVLADKSIDAVCISTPDHWHAYMAVEACKAGKDVYVEKPSCTYVEEGQKMVQAARKYNRVVQAGTMQRSGGYFQKAAELVNSGVARRRHFLPRLPKRRRPSAKATAIRPIATRPTISIGTCGWDRRPKVPFNPNRWGVKTAHLPHFPLFLGLRRRRHDRLGRAPDRSAAPVLRRSDADGRSRRWATSSTSTTTRDARHHAWRRSITRSS